MLLFWILLFPIFSPQTTTPRVEVTFFTESFTFTLPEDYLPPPKQKRWTAAGLRNAYRQLEKTDYPGLLRQWQSIKEAYELNDWLLFQLIHLTHKNAFPKANAAQTDILNWFVLSKIGYDARLAYFDDNIYLYLGSKSFLFEVPFLEEEDKRYLNISAITSGNFQHKPFYWPVVMNEPGNLDFSFSIDNWPKLKARPLNRDFQFNYKQDTIQFTIETNALIGDIMATYPLLEEESYLSAPFSQLSENQILPQIEQQWGGKSLKQKMEWLAAFTRSAFLYREDEEQFGFNKPMVAEETLLYPASDCEDRVALFFQIAHKLVEVPILIIAFPDHVTLGIADPTIGGDYVIHEGKKYFICDPTGPEGSSEIGQMPFPYKGKNFDVLKHRRGKK